MSAFDKLVLVSIYLGAASTIAHTVLTISILST